MERFLSISRCSRDCHWIEYVISFSILVPKWNKYFSYFTWSLLNRKCRFGSTTFCVISGDVIFKDLFPSQLYTIKSVLWRPKQMEVWWCKVMNASSSFNFRRITKEIRFIKFFTVKSRGQHWALFLYPNFSKWFETILWSVFSFLSISTILSIFPVTEFWFWHPDQNFQIENARTRCIFVPHAILHHVHKYYKFCQQSESHSSLFQIIKF